VRTINEDRAFESFTLFAVADGMGGHAGGEVASSVAIEALESGFARSGTIDGLVAAVQDANRAVWERGLDDQALHGMGTTVIAAALVVTDDGDRLVLANVGDSRAYRFHGGTLDQLSTDHSVAEELVAQGALSEAEAAVHPKRHILTRALGISAQVEVDVWEVVPFQGDRYLLCSDGLSNEVGTDVMASVLASVRDPHEAAVTLVGLANDAGGPDNITAVVVDVLVGEPGENSVVEPEAAADPAPSDLTGAVAGVEVGEALAPAVDLAHAQPAPASPPFEPARPKRRGPRRITFRVLFFLILLGALAYGAWYVIKTYVNDSYFVGIQKNELVIYQGRPGGFLGIEPKIVNRTGVTTAQVESIVLPALQHDVQEPTKKAANEYVAKLVANKCSLENPPPTCATGAATTTTVPATTVPSTAAS
jgi:protein phosphatase